MDILQFQEELMMWFKREQRQLPWRKNNDAYRVWVSEIMLQQTRVDTVIPFYNRFMEWFPTINDFAKADEEKVLKSWEGLGYYSRVRNLHEAVKEVSERYGGIVPNELEKIRQLKGIGSYTAGAILSIAYQQPEPAVDGNVMRVYTRLFEIEDDIALPITKKKIEAKVRETISHEDPSNFNQALMELGALICIPKNPQCLLCPVQNYCSSFSHGTERKFPVKSALKKSRTAFLISAVFTTANQEILIRKRANKGLLAGLWEFPTIEVSDVTEQTLVMFRQGFPVTDFKEVQQIAHIKHVFTHLKWEIRAYSAVIPKEKQQQVATEFNAIWVQERNLNQYAFPTPFQRVYEAFVLDYAKIRP